MRQVDRSAAARATLPIMLTMPTKVGTGRPMRQTSLTTPATLTIYPVSPVMVVAITIDDMLTLHRRRTCG